MRDADQELRLRIGLPRAERRIEKLRRRAQLLVRLALRRDVDAAIRRAAIGGEDELASGILLEDVVDHLRQRRTTDGGAVDAFIAPPDRRSQRWAIRRDLPLGLQRFERLPVL